VRETSRLDANGEGALCRCRERLREGVGKHPSVVDPEALLSELAQGGVEFIVVGGAAALLRLRPRR
jgi:hypothetical protein